MAALADLRAFPWFSREWLQAARMIGVINHGHLDQRSPRGLEVIDKSTDASRVLEWMREDVVGTVVLAEDKLNLGGELVTHLFDWVEQHGQDTFIQSRDDLYWYLNQYCALAAAHIPINQARNTAPKLPPRAGHRYTAFSVAAKYAPLEKTCEAAARRLQHDPSTPRSRRSRFSTSSSLTSSDSTASWLSEFSALVAGRLRSRTRTLSAQHQVEQPIAQALEVGGEEVQGGLEQGVGGVTLVEGKEEVGGVVGEQDGRDRYMG
ncbi:hypothetical protein BCR44DRAFT_95353 [Catenaria anguillulae PL171]|uniref:Uncharacterized protein n=1 Tax=Catenaria anguillulae PL171 TaxID=765915 RepID=A0A1Y2HFH1_9FUNG|nr:hypothetical protein BCR44DRAFT_95353 [Catenaria anguillulae PL171]